MAGLGYVGAAPSQPADITDYAVVTNTINALTPNVESITAEVNGLVGTTYATKSQVDTLSSTFVAPSYYETQDLLNIPKTWAGVPSTSTVTGVATIVVPPGGSTGFIPVAQMPTLGAGYMDGPWGLTAASPGGTTDGQPIKVGDWNIGQAEYTFRPLVTLSALVSSLWDQPVIEVWISNTAIEPTTYPAGDGSSLLIGRGVGRYLYNDAHAVVILPAPDQLNETPSSNPPLSPVYQVWITAWLYGAKNLSVTMAGDSFFTSAVYLVRAAQ